MIYININDEILPEEMALISIKDRGFRFGDGVFETCLIFDSIIYNFESHLKRLVEGLNAIKINYNTNHIKKSCYQLISKNKINNGYLRIAISRGIGSVGYLPLKNIIPNLVIETLPPQEKPKSLIKLSISSYSKPSLKSLPVNYKLMQGLNSTLAKIEAQEKDCFDAIILNDQGLVCETSSANIFWIKDDILHTPHQNCGCLLGIVREKIISIAPIKTKLTKAKLENLLTADEVFITNSALGVLPVDWVLDKKFTSKKYTKICSKLLNQDIKNYAKDQMEKLD